MEKFQREFIELLYAAFEKPRISLSADFDMARAVQMAKAHNIAAIVYYGALNCGVDNESPYMQELFSLTCKTMMVSQRQMYEIGRLEAAFEEAEIEYLPLKGTVLKGLYPQPEMRAMGDADILIRLEQYPRIEPIMQELGFAFVRDADHELVWQTSSLYLELHKRAVPEAAEDFYEYFGTGWQMARKIPNRSRCEMSPEDFYVYIFAHFTKHYRSAGIGIKHLLDLWVFRKKYPEMNEAYVAEELKKLKLLDFQNYVMETLNVWFGEAEESPQAELIASVILNSGQFGTSERRLVNNAVRQHKGSSRKARLEKLWKGIFLPYGDMKKRYAAVNRIPVLLPVFWVVRWFEILFFRRYVFGIQRNQSKMMEQENMDKYQAALQFVGLDIGE